MGSKGPSEKSIVGLPISAEHPLKRVSKKLAWINLKKTICQVKETLYEKYPGEVTHGDRAQPRGHHMWGVERNGETLLNE